MAEKILNTKILLKYDTYANWTAKNPSLLQGEIAIASLANSHTPTTPDTGSHPVMFKVGPGNFNDLPWSSALAADVYGWAKEDKLTVTKNGAGTGNVVASIDWDASLNNGKGGLKYEVVSVATSEGFAELQGLLNDLNDTVSGMYTNDDIDAAIKAAKEALSAEIDSDVKELEEAINERLEILEDYDHSTYATKTALEEMSGNLTSLHEDFIETKGRIDTFLDSEEIDNTVNTLHEIKEWIAGEEGSIVTDLTQAIAKEASDRDAADIALSNRIKDLEDNKQEHATKAELNELTTSMGEALDTLNGAVDEAKTLADTKATAAKEAAIADAASKYQLKGDYLTEVTTTVGNGLKITDKNKIDIDDEVVFVFNCGNASGYEVNG